MRRYAGGIISHIMKMRVSNQEFLSMHLTAKSLLCLPALPIHVGQAGAPYKAV